MPFKWNINGDRFPFSEAFGWIWSFEYLLNILARFFECVIRSIQATSKVAMSWLPVM